MELQSTLILNSPHQQEISDLCQTIEALASTISKYTRPVKSISPESYIKMSTLQKDKLIELNNKVKNELLILEATLSFRSPLSNRDFIRNILSFMKMSTTEDFLDSVLETDIVEIYDPQGIQIFRNLKFYETTSYSLSDLLLFEWYELYSRSSKVTQKLFEYAHVVFSDPSNSAHSMNAVPKHVLKEIRANPIQLCEVKFKNISAVLNLTMSKVALIVNCEAQSISHDSDHLSLDFI